MTKLSDLMPGQIWEDKQGWQRELLAVGFKAVVTRVVKKPDWLSSRTVDFDSSEMVWHEDRFKQLLELCLKRVAPTITKWVGVYKSDFAASGYAMSPLYENSSEARKGWNGREPLAVVPVTFPGQ